MYIHACFSYIKDVGGSIYPWVHHLKRHDDVLQTITDPTPITGMHCVEFAEKDSFGRYGV